MILFKEYDIFIYVIGYEKGISDNLQRRFLSYLISFQVCHR